MADIIIQARVGSERLKNKLLLKVKDQTLLDILINRLKRCKKAHRLILAIPDTKENDVLEKVCQTQGIDCFREDEKNVLKRFYLAAQHFSSQTIARITSDCPLMDPELVDVMIETFEKSACDYVTTDQKRCLPRGFDVEVFSFKALEKAFFMTQDPKHLEHVTLFFKTSEEFSTKVVQHPFLNAHFRLTLDTKEDFALLKILLEELDPAFSMLDVFDFLEKNPNIAILNKHIKQKLV